MHTYFVKLKVKNKTDSFLITQEDAESAWDEMVAYAEATYPEGCDVVTFKRVE